jgi:hypothetical protein
MTVQRAENRKQAAAGSAAAKAEKARRASMSSAPLRVVDLRVDDKNDLRIMALRARRAREREAPGGSAPLCANERREDGEADVGRSMAKRFRRLGKREAPSGSAPLRGNDRHKDDRSYDRRNIAPRAWGLGEGEAGSASAPLRVIDLCEDDEADMRRSMALRARGVTEKEAWEGWKAAKDDMRQWDLEKLLADLYAAFVVDDLPACRRGLWGNAKGGASDSETDSDDDDDDDSDTASVSTIVPARPGDQCRRRRRHHQQQHEPGVRPRVRCSVLRAPCRRQLPRDRFGQGQENWLGPVRTWAKLGRRWGRSVGRGQS